jgi:two-component system, NarL family, sensor histidine kinase DegS
MAHKLSEADKTKRMNERVIDVMMDSMEELLEMKDSISLANQEIGKHGGNEDEVEKTQTCKDIDNLMAKLSIALDFLGGKSESEDQQIQSEQLKLLNLKILHAQEEERRRVSYEIHDGPAQSLTNILLEADLCEKLMDIDIDRARLEIKSLKQTARSCISDIRKIIYNLRPVLVNGFGIEQVLQRLLDNFEMESGLSVKLEVQSGIDLTDAALKLAIYRVVQESLNNIKKYAQASYCSVILQKESQHVTLKIIDDGLGFDFGQYQKDSKERFGLSNMRELVGLLNGNLVIESTPGEGTHLTALFPL